MASLTRQIRKSTIKRELTKLAPKVPIYAMCQGTHVGRLHLLEYMIKEGKIEEFCNAQKAAVEALNKKAG